MPEMTRRPLSARPFDMVYFAFFMMHLPATLLVDLQALYPAHLVPPLIAKIPGFYISMSNDPLIGGAMGLLGKGDQFVWFKTFLLLEALFQIPVFVLGMRGLWKDSRSIYVLLLIYAASTTTTTLPCLSVILTTPLTSGETLAAGIVSISVEQRLLLLSSYIPFFLVPLMMTIDMAVRILRLVNAGVAVSLSQKQK
ncbi:hypothetical protein CERSUDRAFT_133352 [Gelatoporia subvermispora B]|uniref:EXPERA domain-containing protein n=1 Tax=Ceriporiopsis subvermispora (strain B) TaxID=914234 RepID=M2RJ09_CERS8|nr:hypothetical protein CERSUDRAFT_133352 [Gelatoporia subvermispora B]